MKEPVKKLLLVIPIKTPEDLMPIVVSEGWHTTRDLFKKTDTSYNTHWNGNFVLDQDEIPWKASREEVDSLKQSSGRVIVILEAKYHISDSIALYADTDGSMYVDEEDVQGLFDSE
jgi:hypothetical protein